MTILSIIGHNLIQLCRHAQVVKPLVRARVIVEMGSHPTKMVPVQSHNNLDQKSRKVIV